jgi:pimeloyl-ACP methyl ester carboxylesterase
MHEFVLPGRTDRLRYLDLPGAQPALVFVHGLGCASSWDYPEVAADPALAPRRRLLVDLPGYGYSDRPDGFAYTVEAHAEVLAALLESLPLAPVDVFGHSMGGSIAITLASRAPHRIRRLVVSEPNLDDGGGVFSRPVAARTEADYVAHGHAAAVRGAIVEGLRDWAATMRIASPLAVHRGATSLVHGASPSWREQLAALPMPRTVIFGARSLPDPDTDWLPAHGVAVRVVPDAGHAMANENPAGLAAAIAAALG